MKKQIILGVVAMLTFGPQNGHAGYVDCEDYDWKTCSYANQNIEICEKGGWTPRYRCKAGFYYPTDRPPTSCTMACNECPSGGTSDPNNNEGITSCYQTPGTHTDTTGTYKVTANCYYKE